MHRRWTRCLAVWTAASAATAAAVAWLLPVATAPADRFDDVLVRACAVVAVAATGWLWLTTGVTVVAALRGYDARGVPAPLRRLVLVACGVALAGGLAAAPAQATPGRPQESRVAQPTAAVAGLFPDRGAAKPSPAVVTVGAGDSLWAIAAERLGPGASGAEVDAEWRRVYALNRTEVGPDPDLIHPAQRLRMPNSEVRP
ncbi:MULTISPECIES: LysM peptidoglycan-binding domain-containing protein [unclassified Nocardioides]|uniref:LysM peptidoglycan-binding domain-containing protein n=1 Tax=unclassified Nocardioides TaxID=2615069 RepID=UPI00361E29F4